MHAKPILCCCLFVAIAIALAACGGGGGSSSGGSNPIPADIPGTSAPGVIPSATVPGETPTPDATPTPRPIPTIPGSTPTPRPTPTIPGSTPSPVPTSSPVRRNGPTKIRSTVGRIGLAQIFDVFGTSRMSAGEIAADAQRYDLVWASSEPTLWRNANPAAVVSRYYIPEEDNVALSGHHLQYWQQNHPDWILYACDANGNPTHDIAYTPGDRSPDVALDIHNPAVVDYQLNKSLVPYAKAHGYNALAIDEVLMTDLMQGGNPSLGETLNTSEFACGIWNNDGTFTKHYSGRNDPQWPADIVNWIKAARQATNAANMALIINHPGGNAADANEQALLANVDAVVDEAGFTDYGNYVSGHSSLFLSTLNYMENAQKHGVAFVDIAKYALNGETTVTSDQIEYAIATYLIGNEGGADLFVVGNNATGVGYGNEQYHSEYAAQLGTPCGSYYGGPSVYYRRFIHGLSVVNAGAIAASASLPNHAYTDIERRPVTNPLSVPARDAFVLTTSGNGCT